MMEVYSPLHLGRAHVVEEEAGQVLVGEGVIGLQVEGDFKGAQGRDGLARLHQQDTQVVVPRGKEGVCVEPPTVDCDGLPPVFGCVVQKAAQQEADPVQVRTGHAPVGNAEDVLQGRYGFLPARRTGRAAPGVEEGELEPGVEMVRVQLDSALEGLPGLHPFILFEGAQAGFEAEVGVLDPGFFQRNHPF